MVLSSFAVGKDTERYGKIRKDTERYGKVQRATEDSRAEHREHSRGQSTAGGDRIR